MDSIPYTPSLTDELIRRKLIVVSALIGTPLFLLFAVMEYQLGRLDMIALATAGSVVCIVNLIFSRYVGFNLTLVRASLGYIYFACIYYVYLDFVSSSLLFCLILPFVASFLLGFREALVWDVILGVVCISLIYNADRLGLTTIRGLHADFISTYVVIVALALTYERTRQNAQDQANTEHEMLVEEIDKKNEIAARNHKLFEDLHEALREVRELNGLIPICTSCKKIRADEGFWEHVEAYLHKRTRLTFSHGLCPACADSAMEELGPFNVCEVDR